MHSGIEARVKARVFSAGYCTGPGKVADKSLPWGKIKFPAPFALIQHPREGWVLFDTGYHPRLYECTQRLPEKLLALSTPFVVETKDTAVTTLEGIGVTPDEIGHLVLSHLHADHTAGVLDFCQAQLYSDPAGWEFIQNSGRLSRARKGYVSRLLPGDFQTRSTFINDYNVCVSKLLGCDGLSTELRGRDLFGDELIYLISLPGHARGHLGMLCRLHDRWLFFLADACWLTDNLSPGHEPHAAAGLIFDDSHEFNNTLGSLQQLYKHANEKILFIPSHCSKTIDKLVEKGWMS